MGSLAEFKEAVKFIAQHQIHPVVHSVFKGLNEAEDAFQIMVNGSQFGKLVIDLTGSPSSSKL
jgi:zinc-binding alcohol dehydrogenase/oxidoreductase